MSSSPPIPHLTPHWLMRVPLMRGPLSRAPQWKRVPFIKQQHDAEDAVACLAMMCAWFGKPLSLEQCRTACSSGPDGIGVEQLIDASRVLGLSAHGWVVQGADAFDMALALPAIVSWHEHRFVIVERVTRHHVMLIDPAFGRRRVGRELFDRCCSGVALTFESVGAAPHVSREELKARETWWVVGLLVASTVFLQICSLALPICTLLVVDHVASGDHEVSMSRIAVVVLLVVAAHGILRFVRDQALAHLRGGGDDLAGFLLSHLIVACLQAWFVIVSLGLVAVWSFVLAAVAVGFVGLQMCVAACASRWRRFGSVADGLVSGMGLCCLLVLLVVGAGEVVAGRLTLAGMLALNVLAAGGIRDREGWR